MGPDSAAVLRECAPGKECGLTLTRCVLHVEGGRPQAGGIEGARPSGYRVDVAGGAPVVLSAGEMIEVAKGNSPGTPRPVDLARLNRWWEEIR